MLDFGQLFRIQENSSKIFGCRIHFSSNVPSVYLPLDQRVMWKVKLLASKVILLRIVPNAMNYDELRKLGGKQHNSMRGLNYFYPAHLLDAIMDRWKAFRSFSKAEVANYWLKDRGTQRNASSGAL